MYCDFDFIGRPVSGIQKYCQRIPAGLNHGDIGYWRNLDPDNGRNRSVCGFGTCIGGRNSSGYGASGKRISAGDFKKSFNFIGQGSLLGIPVPVWILILIIAISGVILHSTKLGRYIFAVGGNEDAARASGISVKHVKFFVYLYMGALCGIVGLILSARTNTGAPNAGAGYELDAIAAAVIGGTSISGGKGHIAGTVIGMLILGVLSNGLDILNISTYIQQIVKGIVIVLAVLMDIVQTKRN